MAVYLSADIFAIIKAKAISFYVMVLVMMFFSSFSPLISYGSADAFTVYSEIVNRGELSASPFIYGEELVYSVSYMGVAGGELVLRIEDVILYDDSLCYKITATIKSNKTFSMFYRVDNYVESIYDVLGGFSRRYHINQREGRYSNDKTIILDYKNKRADFSSKNSDNIEVKVLERFLQDSLSIFYEIRKRDFSAKDLYEIPVISGKTEYDLKIELLGSRRVRSAIGTHDTWHVKPYLLKEGEFKDKGDLEIFITKDNRRIPVLMTLEVVFGSIKAELKSVRLPRVKSSL